LSNLNIINLSVVEVSAGGYFFKGKTAGRMGVVGPTRMDYDRALRTVNCLSGLISAKLEELDR